MRRTFVLALLLLLSLGASAEARLAESAVVQFTPSASAYTSGQCIGPAGASAVQTLAFVAPSGQGGALITDAEIVDDSGQGPNVDLYLFTAPPSGTYTDQATCSLAAADEDNVIGPISFTSFTALGTPKTARLGSLLTAINTQAGAPVSSASVWFVLVSRGTPTFGAAHKITVRLGGYADQ